ncbi:ParB/RepB/Spo0J family partition protein [Rikenella microfusus]|uniref:Probable chromosome-partitioning protein parB n=2 Tax=Rikenella microfusus TaxID=28139 RepID=A0A379MSS5_9BACT|nr:ParB/RepB/Spo0J family partition protein [Rikenella microfusus]SUE34784.1 Probable chromosome-partitioning protein parB [Rikenella microfusus]
MKPKTTGLGKGLGAIFEIEELNIPKQTAASRRDNTVADIELARIVPNPGQPRTLFDEEALEELAQSISRLGVIQPITVKRIENPEKDGAEYMIISGERRFRASQIAGLDTIPAYVREANDQTLLEMALVENIQREDLGAIEVALSLQRLIDECSLTQEILAERVGKKRSTIANYIRLLKLPAQIQSALNNDMISMGHARALLGLPGERQQLAMLAKIVKGHLSVRQTELAVQQALAPSKGAAGTVKDNTEYPVCYSQLVERLEPLVGSRISIKRKAVTGKNGKTAFQGKIVIDFESDEQVKEILGRLEKLSVKN